MNVRNLFITPVSRIRNTMTGMLDFAEGNIQDRVQKIFLGMNFQKWFLIGGAIEIAAKGTGNFVQGIRRFSCVQTIKGIAQCALGLASSALTASLDAEMLAESSQAALLMLTSSTSMLSGANDITKGFYLRGAAKTLFGIGGLAVSGHYFYQVFAFHLFLQEHRDEINYIQSTNQGLGNWRELGHGASKVVFTHPDMQDYVIKFPLPSGNLQNEWNNILYAKKIIEEQGYENIIIPDSYLMETDNGHLLFQNKLNLAQNLYGYSTIKGDQAVEREFFDFLRKSYFCDITLRNNAAYLEGTGKIGIYDFDCLVKDPLLQKRHLEVIAIMENYR